MKNNIEPAIVACHLCQAHRQTQVRPPAVGTNPTTVEKPMDEIGFDLFDGLGKKRLATVDCYLGYA